MSSTSRYQTFVAVSGNLGGKVQVVDDMLSSDGKGIYPTTSFDEKCIEYELQTGRSYYVDLRQTYLDLKLKFVKGRRCETYIIEEVGKKQKEEVKVDVETEEDGEKEVPVHLVTHVNTFSHTRFSNVEVYVNN